MQVRYLSHYLYYMAAEDVAQPGPGKSQCETSGVDPSPPDGRHYREPRGIRGVREDGRYGVTLITQSWVSTWVTGHEFCPRSTTITHAPSESEVRELSRKKGAFSTFVTQNRNESVTFHAFLCVRKARR